MTDFSFASSFTHGILKVIERLVPVTIGSAPPSSRRPSLSAPASLPAQRENAKRPTFAGVGRFFLSMLRIATWNINSVRLRQSLVARFLEDVRPDILCLQEIKCKDELFPRERFEALGYSHIAISGQAGYHGVATLSKFPLSPLPKESFCGTAEARHLGCEAALPSGRLIAIHNIYVPAGGDIPDPGLNPKFKQKLAY